MATLTVQNAKRAANAITYASAAEAGDDFVNTGSQGVLITNGSGAPITVTVTTTATVDSLAVADLEVTVPNGETHLIGPFPKEYYNDGDNKVSIGYSDHTSVEVAVIGGLA